MSTGSLITYGIIYTRVVQLAACIHVLTSNVYMLDRYEPGPRYKPWAKAVCSDRELGLPSEIMQLADG